MINRRRDCELQQQRFTSAFTMLRYSPSWKLVRGKTSGSRRYPQIPSTMFQGNGCLKSLMRFSRRPSVVPGPIS